MAKATEPKASAQRVPRTRSLEEMQAALAALLVGNTEQGIAPNYDRPGDVLFDAIHEIISLRQIRTDVLAFVQDQSNKLTRR